MSEASSLRWKKSTKSGQNNCVEVTQARDGRVLVRDSKNPDGPVLAFSIESWQDFITAICQD